MEKNKPYFSIENLAMKSWDKRGSNGKANARHLETGRFE